MNAPSMTVNTSPAKDFRFPALLIGKCIDISSIHCEAPCVIVRDRRPGPSDQAVGKVWLARTAIPTPQIAAPMRRGVGAILEVPCRRTISAVAVASKV
jgi:hypothetical protein